VNRELAPGTVVPDDVLEAAKQVDGAAR
jgi:hypothetical protein